MGTLTIGLEKELEKEIYKESYYEFFKKAFAQLHPDDDYDDNWHLQVICDALQAEFERICRKEPRTKDLVINVPFRSAKSLACTVIFPVWCWTRRPVTKFIAVSYAESLALEHAQKAKDIINGTWFQHLYGDLIEFKRENNSKEFYENTAGGFRKSVGVNGQITGSGADFIIVDDPQNPRRAASQVERENAKNFYDGTLYSRLNQLEIGVRIIVMQRLHEEDLSGHVVGDRPEDHHHICIPAEITQKNIHEVQPQSLLKYYRDGLFWDSRFTHKVLASYKKTLKSEYAGQLLQRPAPPEGNLVKSDWFEVVDASAVIRNPINDPIKFYIDSAFTAKTENDPTALLACFKHNNDLYIVNIDEQWMEFPELVKYIPRYARSHGYTDQSILKIEPKANGKSIIQELKSETGINVTEITLQGNDDKTTRLNSITSKLEAKRVKLIRGSWNKAFLDQIASFPFARHDDMVDVLVYAVLDNLQGDDFDFDFLSI